MFWTSRSGSRGCQRSRLIRASKIIGLMIYPQTFWNDLPKNMRAKEVSGLLPEGDKCFGLPDPDLGDVKDLD